MTEEITTVFVGARIMECGDTTRKIQDRRFVALLQASDPISYTKLYERYSRFVRYTIWRIVKIDNIAEDLTQDTFIKIFKTIHQYEPNKGKLQTWIMSIARNTGIDYVRSKYYSDSAKNIELSLLETEIEAQYPIQLNIDVIDMPNLLSVLTNLDQWILKLCYFQGFTHPEAADQIGLPLGTLKSRIRKSMQLLRLYISSDGAKNFYC